MQDYQKFKEIGKPDKDVWIHDSVVEYIMNHADEQRLTSSCKLGGAVLPAKDAGTKGTDLIYNINGRFFYVSSRLYEEGLKNTNGEKIIKKDTVSNESC